jgi:alpha-tubulin suppressor-like RCC1 family protein
MPTTDNISWVSHGSSFATELYLGSQRVWPAKYISLGSQYKLGDNKILYSLDGGTSGIPSSIQGKTRYIKRGSNHYLATLTDNTVVGWGSNFYGEISIPSSIQGRVVKAIGACQSSFALLDDGTVRHWGRVWGTNNQIPSSLTGVVDIFTLCYDPVVIKSDGTVFSWSGGTSSVPLNRIIKIALDYNVRGYQQDDGSLTTYGQTYRDVSSSAEIIDFTFAEARLRTLRLNGDWWHHEPVAFGPPERLLAQNIAVIAEDNFNIALDRNGNVITVV